MKCGHCESTNTYIRILSKEAVCRRCGGLTKIDPPGLVEGEIVNEGVDGSVTKVEVEECPISIKID